MLIHTDSKEKKQDSIAEPEIEESSPWHALVEHLGIDLGYGFVKIINGADELKFPSVVGLGSN